MRRYALRRLRADDGLTLLETVVALLVFSLIMGGLAGSMTLLARTAAVNKARSIAVSLAQKYIEEARAKGGTNVQLCPGTSPPPPQTVPSFNGQTNLTMAIATQTTSTCLTYQKTKSVGSYSYTVTTQVMQDGQPGTTIAGQPIVEKYLDVVLTWTAPKPGSYELSTVLNNNTTITATEATGLQFDMQDGSGNKIGTATVTWHFKVCASTVTCNGSQTNVLQEGDTQENGQPLVTMAAGTYNCFLDNTNASGWVPNATKNPANYTLDMTNGTISGPCTVTSGQVLDWITYWQPIGSCAYSSTTKGGLNVYVVDQNGTPVKNASVTISPVTGTGTYAAKPSGNGSATAGYYASFTGLPDDFYYYNVDLTGYNSVTNLGPACVAGTKVTTAKASITSSSGCATTGNNGNVTVTVTDASGVKVGNNSTVGLFNATTGAWVAVGKTTAGVVTKTGVPSGAYYLLVSDSTTTGAAVNGVTQYKYDGSGAIGPLCVADTTAAPNGNAMSATLQPYQTNQCPDTNSNGTLNVTVMDGAGHAVGNAPVQYINIDAIGAPQPGATVKSNATTGAASLGSRSYDPYLIIGNSPAATQATGYFMTLGATCVNANPKNYTINLNGYATVLVGVDNESAPIKTYNIVITDSTPQQNQTTQSLTVIQGSSNAVSATFSHLPTGTGYNLAVYSATDTGDNGSLVCSGTYDWTGVTTYPNANNGTPPTCVDSSS